MHVGLFSKVGAHLIFINRVNPARKCRGAISSFGGVLRGMGGACGGAVAVWSGRGALAGAVACSRRVSPRPLRARPGPRASGCKKTHRPAARRQVW